MNTTKPFQIRILFNDKNQPRLHSEWPTLADAQAELSHQLKALANISVAKLIDVADKKQYCYTANGEHLWTIPLF